MEKRYEGGKVLKKIKSLCAKLFGGLNMSWRNVIIFAVVAGAYTGLINSLPFLAFLQNTSFTDIAVTYEWWIFFAVIIVANCKKPLEAGLKTFVFFLISQPLVYLVEVPFQGWGVFVYYQYWFYMTLLTFPGAIIAYYGTHRKDILGALIMCVATGMLTAYISTLVKLAPDRGQGVHVLTLIFCILQVILYIFYFIRQRAIRVAAIILNIAMLVVFACIQLNAESRSGILLPVMEEWGVYELTEGENYRVEFDGNELSVYWKPQAKETDIILTTGEGEKLRYHLAFGEGGIMAFELVESGLTLSMENVALIRENLDDISWKEFELYKADSEEDDVAVYKVGEDYELVLMGRDGDLIGKMYLRRAADGEEVESLIVNEISGAETVEVVEAAGAVEAATAE